MNALRILVADDHEIVRRGIVALLEGRAGWEVCGEAHDGRDAVEKTKELKPDIVILDIGMPNLNGLEAARQMLHHNPQTKVLILTITEADELVRAVLDAGARGFVLKSDATRDLISAVEALPIQQDLLYFEGGGYGVGRISRPTPAHRRRKCVTANFNAS